jgi:hypothetical protein
MTPENFDALLAHQNGVCALCHKAYARTMHVDHDHETDGVRGLLCAGCNLMLGLVESFAKRAEIDMQSVGQSILDYLDGPQYYSETDVKVRRPG